MGMRVSGFSQAGHSAMMTQWHQRQQNFKDLFSALKAGDLAGAQKAMSTLNPSGNISNGPLAAINAALQDGDLKAAQDASSNLRPHHHSTPAVVNQDTQSMSTSVTQIATGRLLNLGLNVNTSA